MQCRSQKARTIFYFLMVDWVRRTFVVRSRGHFTILRTCRILKRQLRGDSDTRKQRQHLSEVKNREQCRSAFAENGELFGHVRQNCPFVRYMCSGFNEIVWKLYGKFLNCDGKSLSQGLAIISTDDECSLGLDDSNDDPWLDNYKQTIKKVKTDYIWRW
jgi:hypothetical protein